MSSINKKYIQEQLVQHERLDSEQAMYIVRDFFSVVSQSLQSGREVNIYGFGNFRLLRKQSRPGRDILRKCEVTIDERTVVSFIPSQKLVEKITQGHTPS